MQFIRSERGTCSFLLFQTIPDLGLLRHFPRPEHYDRNYQYIEGEPVHPDNIHIFTNPWQRVGHPDFYLNTFDETARIPGGSATGCTAEPLHYASRAVP
jgi:hypothetical protein